MGISYSVDQEDYSVTLVYIAWMNIFTSLYFSHRYLCQDADYIYQSTFCYTLRNLSSYSPCLIIGIDRSWK